ncbi:acyl-CoA thioesterase [Nesterenkonia marinintestina]|uniref:acyl-CoA thioesterase n=1 Tax=Nesterenkonia marinintestina TaxID=2979865 RepID=UPI0021C25295|nr:acyl-CoA thioesterase II [Nesterenkonia sp. GX14115]
MSPRDAQVPNPQQAADQLAAMFDLEELGAGEGTRTTEDRFLGRVQEQAFWRVFGGQVLAQAAQAGMRTVAEDRVIHSLHGYFLRPGDATRPIEFGVERLRDGGSFSARRTHAYQDGVPILSMIASYQRPSRGPDHQRPMPAGIPDPDDLPSPRELVGHVDHPIIQEWAHGRPFEIRHVDRPLYLEADRVPRPHNAVWMRCRGRLPDDPNLHRAAILYASDYTLLEPVLRNHRLYWGRPGMKIASLDHAMWWHRDAPADDWLLFVQESPSAQGARGLGTGSIFDRSGRHVATVAQEGMVRAPDGLAPWLKERILRARVGKVTRSPRTASYEPVWRSREAR